MKLKSIFISGLLALSTCPAAAQDASNNQQIIAMVRAGLPETVIVSSIREMHTGVDRSPQALIALRQAGASDAVIAAVAAPNGPSPTRATAPAAVSMPGQAIAGVLLVDGSQQTSLMVAPVRLSMGMARMFTGGTLGRLWATIPFDHAAIRTTNRRPSFRITLASNFDPQTELGVIRLESRGRNLRYVYHSILNQDPERVIPGAFRRVTGDVSSTIWEYTPTADLPPGEFALLFGQENATQAYPFGID